MNSPWTDKVITFRNTLFTALHPKCRANIGAISKICKDPNKLKDFDGLALDFSSGMRTHGYFVFTNKSIGGKYFGEENNMGRINYGSMLMTECRVLYRLKLRILVLEESSEEGQKYGLGDSHGKISPKILELMKALNPDFDSEQPEDEKNPQLINRDTRIPLQFRMGIQNNVLAKGTVASLASLLKEDKYDLVLPKSCFKAKKPEGDRAERTTEVHFAIVHEAKNSPARGGQMLWQWFSYPSLLKDVMPATFEKAKELSEATNNIHALAAVLGADSEELLMDDQNDEQYGVGVVEKREQTEEDGGSYRDILLEIVAADKYGQLTKHPFIVNRLIDRLRKRWLRLALNGAVQFRGLMGMPSERIPHHSFVSGDLPAGEYFAFRNPIRYHIDIKIWENVSSERTKGLNQYKGVAFIPTDTAAEVGGDFDGDKFNVIQIENMPNLSEEAKNLTDKYKDSSTREVVKYGKVPITGTLAEVAIRSMDSKVGIVADLIMRAQAVGLIHIKYDFPKFDHVTGKYAGEWVRDAENNLHFLGETVAMTVLDFLAQEMQVAVDRLKNNLFHDERGLGVVQGIISNEVQPPWVSDRKREEVYSKRPMHVRYGDDIKEKKVPGKKPSQDQIGELPPDTVSQMISHINDVWRPLDVELEHVSKFRNLFPSRDKLKDRAPYTEEMLLSARALNKSYGVAFSKIRELDEKALNEPDTEKVQGYRDEARRLLESILKDTQAWRENIDAFCRIAQARQDRGVPLEDIPDDSAEYLEFGIKEINKEQVAASEYDWACAFWDACHGISAGDNSTGGLVFRMFPDYIKAQLQRPGINRIDIVGCQYHDLKEIVWGNPDAEPAYVEDEQGRTYLSTWKAKYDPNNLDNKYLMKPENARNVVDGQFVVVTQPKEPPRIQLQVRSNIARPWKTLGVIPKSTEERPPLNQSLQITLYTQSVVPQKNSNSLISRTVLAIWMG
jgi:hypothetical protein